MSAYRDDRRVRVDFGLVPEDFHIRERGPIAKRIRRVHGLIATVVLAVVGFALYNRLADSVVACAAIAIVAATLLLVVLRVNARKSTTQDSRRWIARRDAYVEADEERFVYGDKGRRTEYAWELIAHWREVSTHFYVLLSPSTYFVIPKRELSDEVTADLRGLFAARIPRGGNNALLRSAMQTVWYGWFGGYLLGVLVIAFLVELIASLV